MANTGAENPSHLEAAIVAGDECEVKMSSPTDYVLGDGTGRGQPGETIDQPSPQNVRACDRGEGEDRGAGNGHVNIPPWSIELVTLIGPTEMESVNIPRDAQSEVAAISPEIKYVRLDIAWFTNYVTVVNNVQLCCIQLTACCHVGARHIRVGTAEANCGFKSNS